MSGWKIRMAFSENYMSVLVSSMSYRLISAKLIVSGLRVPFYMVSPWTRGNRVFTERADHNSQILFLEQWLTARGYENVQTPEMVHWRREHMSNLVSALDLDHVRSHFPNVISISTMLTVDQ